MKIAPTEFALWTAFGSISAAFIISGNMLTNAGVPYISEGGNPLCKIHPATYLAVAALFIHTLRRAWPLSGGYNPSNDKPELSIFIAAMTICVLYALLLNGSGGVIAIIDTFMPAGMIALVLADASSCQRDTLRRILVVLFLFNAVFASAETVLRVHFIPLARDAQELPADFRPTAFYDHPLSGATATMLGVLLRRQLKCVGISKRMYDVSLFTALLSFGGRVALLLSIAATSGPHIHVLIQSGFRRRFKLRDPMTVALSCVLVVSAGGIALGSGLAERLVSHLYWDPSAQARVHQYAILDLMNVEEIVFGCRRADLIALIEPLRLNYGVDVIESFWLLMFATLGVLCFPVFIFGFLALLKFLWRTGDVSAKLMVVTFVVAASTSNSLGRKSTLLVVLVASVAACSDAKRNLSKPVALSGTRFLSEMT